MQVKPKTKQFACAFYHALQDTLVADNLAQAVKLANDGGKRWRVVTLEGQVFIFDHVIELRDLNAMFLFFSFIVVLSSLFNLI